jgi:regulator of PEP synthase PpsR (kinase-PPPase family)
VRRLGAAENETGDREGDDLERDRRVEPRRLGDRPGEPEHDRHEQNEAGAEQEERVLERVPRMARRAGVPAPAAARERDHRGEDLDDVQSEQPEQQVVHAPTISPRGYARRVRKPPVELHVVSDATGETAARLVQALEAQFPDQEFVEIRHPRVESEDDLQLAVNRMRGRPAVVVYTLVKPELREAMRTLCRRARLHYCDLLGQPIEAVARVSGMAAKMTPGSRPPLNSAYFKRMEAIEFAVRFDDGVGRGLQEADVVLVGVSRTSKTPLSIYLGYLGYKAANVPVVKSIEAPKELFDIEQAKIVGLTIDPNRLAEIRRARVRTMGGGARNRQYAELMEIYEELDQAAKLHRRLGCPVIDISELSIEETAHRILRVVEERRSA